MHSQKAHNSLYDRVENNAPSGTRDPLRRYLRRDPEWIFARDRRDAALHFHALVSYSLHTQSYSTLDLTWSNSVSRT